MRERIPGTKLFVGNFDPNCTAEDIRSLFEEYGKVVECDLVRDYCFVHMATAEEASMAIRTLDGYMFDGRRLSVERSTSEAKGGSDKCFHCGELGHWSRGCPKNPNPPSRGPSASGPQTKIFVGNFDPSCTSADIRTLFEKHGVVRECDMMKNYCFVHMATPEAAKTAIEALDGESFGGRKLVVEPSSSDLRRVPGLGGSDKCFHCNETGHWSRDCPSRSGGSSKAKESKIYVGNLDENTDIQKVCQLFAKYGTVTECARVKQFCFIHMKTAESARTAIEHLQGSELDGRKLTIQISTSKPGQKNECFSCGQSGHMKKDCPGPDYGNSRSSGGGPLRGYSDRPRGRPAPYSSGRSGGGGGYASGNYSSDYGDGYAGDYRPAPRGYGDSGAMRSGYGGGAGGHGGSRDEVLYARGYADAVYGAGRDAAYADGYARRGNAAGGYRMSGGGRGDYGSGPPMYESSERDYY